MKKATFIILVVLGAVLLWPADSLASNPSPDITPQYRYLQDNDIRFERISVEGGLSQSTVTCIIQDHQGYMWFGTRDGLNKYNGYEFEIFDHDPENLLSLSDNTVRVIFEDYQGVLWVGTNHGLNRFDSRTGLFNSYIYFKDIGNNTIRDNFEDRIGVLWIGTDTGLFYYDRSTNRFHSIEMIKPSDGLSAKLVLSVHEDRMGTLWIGTFQGGLNKYDRETFKFTHYRKSDGLPSDVVYGILGDDLGFLWL
ncbi:MAG: hypothetical protein H8E17_16600, partial [Deltaproteobacteria bacterium]|nr:hypothetical protein [Deltaproteobacteria bacterium]